MRSLLNILLIFLISVLACNTVDKTVNDRIYHRSPMSKQILKPREGFKGLTNRICLEYRESTCIKEEIKEYLLEDKSFRNRMNDFGFICYIGDKRFKVCLDKPGFCRFEGKCVKKEWVWFEKKCTKTKLQETYLPVSNYQYLLDADTKCWAR